MKFSITLMAATLLLIFGLFPTRNHYWDGIGFSLNIEGLSQDSRGIEPDGHSQDNVSAEKIYFNPNHLLFNLAGYAIYRTTSTIFPEVRAFDVLRSFSTATAIGCAILVALILHRTTGQLTLSILCALAMSFSATWWKYASDANAYIPSTFFLTAAFFVLTRSRITISTVLIGALLHAAAMLLHQIAIFFFPAALLILYRSSPRLIPAYLLATSLPVTAAYAAVWIGALGHKFDLAPFLRWITFNGSDVLNHHSLPARIAESFRSSLRLIFGGRISLARAFISTPVLIALAATMATALALFLRRVIKSVPTWRKPTSTFTGFLVAWVGAYGLFLLFWLTEYPYYRIFYLPALAILLGLFAAANLKPRPNQTLASLVVFVAICNFTFYIYPYSMPEATPPVKLAEDAREIWGKEVLVLYKEFSCDNWIMRHFNDQTKWRRAAPDLSSLLQQVKDAHAAGHSVWIDTSVLGHIEEQGSHRELNKHLRLSDHFGIDTRKHQIRFAKITPHDSAAAGFD